MDDSTRRRQPALKGRGALGNPPGRFNATRRESVDDGWSDRPPIEVAPLTRVDADRARSVISRNHSPDIPFDQSINPYRGCEHGCIYCYARPTHAWLGLSPGLEFESRLFYKADAANLLRTELSARGYRCRPLAIGVNTDAYQPIERRLGVTRQIVEVLHETRHPAEFITKSAAIERDLDLLADMARDGLVQVAVSITTLDGALARSLEPRAASPQRRLQVIETLAAAGVPVGVFAAPVIPALTDADLEEILGQARSAGAVFASWSLLRLPLEVRDLFVEWLRDHYPDRASHVMSLIRAARGGRENDARFGRRMRGEGVFSDLLGQRFELSCRRLGYAPAPDLRTDLFRPPSGDGQLALF